MFKKKTHSLQQPKEIETEAKANAKAMGNTGGAGNTGIHAWSVRISWKGWEKSRNRISQLSKVRARIAKAANGARATGKVQKVVKVITEAKVNTIRGHLEKQWEKVLIIGVMVITWLRGATNQNTITIMGSGITHTGGHELYGKPYDVAGTGRDGNDQHNGHIQQQHNKHKQMEHSHRQTRSIDTMSATRPNNHKQQVHGID